MPEPGARRPDLVRADHYYVEAWLGLFFAAAVAGCLLTLLVSIDHHLQVIEQLLRIRPL